jgi:hypothetical protein
MTSDSLLPILLALSAQATPPSADENPLSASYMPLRAPMLAHACTAPEDDNLGYRLVGFCAGFVTAVLENDPRLADCHPFRGEVMEAIVARHRTAPKIDDDELARDFVVEVARGLCTRARR